MKKLIININHTQGALERILRIVRHRGFDVQNCNITLQPNDIYQMHLVVNSLREHSNLVKQLDKQIDVVSIAMSKSNRRRKAEQELNYAFGS